MAGCADESNSAQKSTVPNSIAVSLGQQPSLELRVGDTQTVCFKVTSSSPIFNSDIKLSLSDSDVIDAELEKISTGYVYCKVTAKKSGYSTVGIYIPKLNLNSPSVAINVRGTESLGITAALGDAPQISLSKGEAMLLCFKSHEGVLPDDVQITLSNDSVASVTYASQKGSYFYYKIVGLEPGKTTLYAEILGEGLKSEEITVTVLGSGSFPEGTDAANAAFVCSKNSNTFHKLDCSHTSQIHEENKLFFTEEQREELINSGKEPCKSCNP